MDDSDSAGDPTQLLATKSIRPNSYNSNRMSPRQMQELVAEIKHLGGLPHPIVVRPLAEPVADVCYEIVDGEHRYRAARKIGLRKVPCVVITASDYEARRQTYKRNRGGTDNKVLLGDAFRSMQELGGKSRRQLAGEINVPEATIRAAEEYAKAGKLRQVCAPDTYIKDINGLKQAQVEMYLFLPKNLRDAWLDAGAEVQEIKGLRGMHWTELVEKIDEFGLAPFAKTGKEFARSMCKLGQLAKWLVSRQDLSGINNYVQAVAKHDVSVDVINSLPFVRRDGELTVAITQEVWESAVAVVAATSSTGFRDERLEIDAAVRSVLAADGIDLAEVLGPAAAEDYSVVVHGPQFIRDASAFLTLPQQRWLIEVDQDCSDDIADKVLTAKEMTVLILRDQGLASTEELSTIYQEQLAQTCDDPDAGGFDSYDPAATLASMIAERTSLDGCTVLNRPAVDVLRDRLDALTAAEFNLFLRAVIGQLDDDDGKEWLDHVTSECGWDVDDSGT